MLKILRTKRIERTICYVINEDYYVTNSMKNDAEYVNLGRGGDMADCICFGTIGDKCHFLNVPGSFSRACERLFEPERGMGRGKENFLAEWI